MSYIGSIYLGANLYRPRHPLCASMERKLNVDGNEDFETWKLYRDEVQETHQAEFALK